MGKYLRKVLFYGSAILGGLTVGELGVSHPGYGFWILFLFIITFFAGLEQGMNSGKS